jgi:hypothetical protein
LVEQQGRDETALTPCARDEKAFDTTALFRVTLTMTGRSFRLGCGRFWHSPFYQTRSGLSFAYVLYLNIVKNFYIGVNLGAARLPHYGLAQKLT